MKDDALVVVKNRNNGTTGYVLPDSNVRRSFAPGESKKIPLAELRSLQYAPGGSYILDNLLIVEDKEALDNLNMKVEPEYFYDEAKIKDLLYNADMDAFLDFLDFATEGAIEIAKDIAVKEQIPDVRKREAISKKTGFSIESAINVNKIMNENEEKAEAPSKERRVQPQEENKVQRRTAVPEVNIPKSGPATPQYNVVKKD